MFIKLTKVSDGTAVWVNPHWITTFFELPKGNVRSGTAIVFKDDVDYDVKESAEKIAKLCRKAGVHA